MRIGRVAVQLLAVDDHLAVGIVAVVEIGMVVLDAVVIDADRDAGARILVPDRLDVADGLEVPLVGVERIVRPHLLTPSEPEPMLPPRRIAASSYANCIAEDKRGASFEFRSQTQADPECGGSQPAQKRPRLYNLKSQASTCPLPLTSIVPRGSKTNWSLSCS